MVRLVATLQEHPLLKAIVIGWVVLTLASGVLHELQVAGDVLLVLIRHTAEQLHEVRETFAAVWRELRAAIGMGSRGDGHLH